MESVRTLIVDDSSVMRKIVERVLRQAGIPLGQVMEAANGSQALDIIRQQTVDLVLADVNMPVMDGLELVRQLHDLEQARAVPVLMISNEGSESRVREAIACGARGYVRKPFTPEQMKRQVLPLLAPPV
jgi:two-component system, chemotaxis family, chemotaxis protein CheY